MVATKSRFIGFQLPGKLPGGLWCLDQQLAGLDAGNCHWRHVIKGVGSDCPVQRFRQNTSARFAPRKPSNAATLTTALERVASVDLVAMWAGLLVRHGPPVAVYNKFLRFAP